MISYILAVFCGALILAFDRITKHFIMVEFFLNEERDFLPGFIRFHYIHNKGGAWGFLEGNTWILISVTVLLMVVCVALLLKKGVQDKLLFWAISFILFGGLGNMFDRIFYSGNVTDFIELEFMKFPIFNIADCGVVIGAGMLVLYFAVEMIKDYKTQKKA